MVFCFAGLLDGCMSKAELLLHTDLLGGCADISHVSFKKFCTHTISLIMSHRPNMKGNLPQKSPHQHERCSPQITSWTIVSSSSWISIPAWKVISIMSLLQVQHERWSPPCHYYKYNMKGDLCHVITTSTTWRMISIITLMSHHTNIGRSASQITI